MAIGSVSPPILCPKCNIYLPSSAFASTPFPKKRRRNSTARIVAPKPTLCKSCSPKQVERKECAGCGKILRLNRFSKSQRRRGETAMCMPCVEENDAVAVEDCDVRKVEVDDDDEDEVSLEKVLGARNDQGSKMGLRRTEFQRALAESDAGTSAQPENVRERSMSIQTEVSVRSVRIVGAGDFERKQVTGRGVATAAAMEWISRPAPWNRFEADDDD